MKGIFLAVDDTTMSSIPDWTLFGSNDNRLDPKEICASCFGYYPSDLAYGEYFDEYDVDILASSDALADRMYDGGFLDSYDYEDLYDEFDGDIVEMVSAIVGLPIDRVYYVSDLAKIYD